MGKNSFASLLVGLLFLCALVMAGLALLYVQHVGEFRRLQGQVNVITTQQNVIRSLLQETVEHSKKDPGLDPILQSVGAKAAANSRTGK